MFIPLSAAEIPTQPAIINAYLEHETSIFAMLSDSIRLPYGTSNVTITDLNNGEKLPIVSVDTTLAYHVVLVGDLQRHFGAQNNWNPVDDTTQLIRVHANLYQFTGSLPAGTYHYKLAFQGNWDAALPDNDILLTIPPRGAKVVFSFIPFELTSKQQQIYDSINHPTAPLPLSSAGLQINLIQITLAEEVDVTHTLQMALKGYQPQNVQPRNVLNSAKYTYDGTDLGNIYCPGFTRFRLWAPTATDVQLLLYNEEAGPLTRQVAMQPGDKGTWYTEVIDNLEDWYYLYQLTIHGSLRMAVDPYTHAQAVNATRGMIIDSTKTNPDGWDQDRYQQLHHPVDAIIYETHIRDFSIDDNSGMLHKGQYLAFTERGTKGPHLVATGVDSLLELGITHVQVLPVYDFASIDENEPEQYNWGYDPRNYNVPEGAYATTPHGTARISEFKRMVQSLHASQLGVIMDVVYNHTFAIQTSDFDKIVPQYYYRTDYAGNYSNGSGVGNEFATERPMVQKFVRDSLHYWTREYHIDGFRFDLMALLGVDTMRKVSEDLRVLNPYVLLYGEPWAGGSSLLPGKQLLTKGQQKGMGIGVFNDNIRNALIGGVFDRTMQGFATGASGQVDMVRRAIFASLDDFTTSPSETINYVTSHDNLTLWDKITCGNPSLTGAERIKMDELAQAIIFTAQGIPFMQGGEEFLRTKDGNDNSYKAGDTVNHFNWARKAQYHDVFNYYAGLINLRKNHPAFRMTTAAAIRQNLTFLDSPYNTIAFLLNGHANGDLWDQIIVIYNPNTVATSFDLPTGTWNVIANQGHVSDKVLDQATKSIMAPAISCLILYQQKEL